MCGRFCQTMTWKQISLLFDGQLLGEIPLSPQYNIAPSAEIATIIWDAASHQPRVIPMTWGLKPDWARSLLINAQAEKYVGSSHTFWASLQRCVILATGFYEWQRVGRRKIPMFIQARGGRPLLMAGLWMPRGDTDAQGPACVIMTTTPNALMEPIHRRMPAILSLEQVPGWLAPGADRRSFATILGPIPATRLEAFEVGPEVNNARNEGPGLMTPVEAATFLTPTGSLSWW